MEKNRLGNSLLVTSKIDMLTSSELSVNSGLIY